jgi:two-component system sensor histidine kinase/response regulator
MTTNKDIEADKFSPDIFDLSTALEVVDGDTELFKEIAGIFLENLPHDLGKIRDAITNNDAYKLERAAHSLKGSVANLGARLSFEASYRLEKLGKENRMEYAEEALTQLEKQVRELEAALTHTIGDL